MKNLFCFSILAVAISGCDSANQNAPNAANANNQNAATANKPAPQKNPQTAFERALFSVRVEEFEQVLVFDRTDGGALSREDKDFLRANSPAEPGRTVNRWTITEDGKTAIAGTNFKFTRAHLTALKARFNVRDFTTSDTGAEAVIPPDAPTPPPANANKK